MKETRYTVQMDLDGLTQDKIDDPNHDISNYSKLVKVDIVDRGIFDYWIQVSYWIDKEWGDKTGVDKCEEMNDMFREFGFIDYGGHFYELNDKGYGRVDDYVLKNVKDKDYLSDERYSKQLPNGNTFGECLEFVLKDCDNVVVKRYFDDDLIDGSDVEEKV